MESRRFFVGNHPKLAVPDFPPRTSKNCVNLNGNFNYNKNPNVVGGLGHFFSYIGNKNPKRLSYFSEGWLSHQPEMYGARINKLQKSPMRSNQPMCVILSETGCLRVAISNRATTMNIRSAASAELKVNEDERFVRFPKIILKNKLPSNHTSDGGKILHQLVDGVSRYYTHYLQCFVVSNSYPAWCRI